MCDRASVWHKRNKLTLHNAVIFINNVYFLLDTGTYDIQNVAFKSCFDEDKNSNGIHILGDFINGTDATGVLIMGYSTAQAMTVLDVHYFSMVAHLSQNQPLSLQAFVSGLYYDSYNVTLFIIDKNGLPIHHIATRSTAVNFSPTMIACGK